MSPEALARMAGAIRHRGPDGYGFYADRSVGLAHVRLSIIDLAGGAQPIASEDGQVIVTFNGEIFNYVELMAQLEGLGHRFRSRSDTEVLVHGWEQWGAGLLPRLLGQFAFAIRDRRADSLILARDRFGVRPLYYAQPRRGLVFASEAKALFASGEVDAAPDGPGLDQVFTFWAARPPRTPFRDVLQLEPGCMAIWQEGRLHITRWYQLDFPGAPAEDPDALQRLDEIMTSAVALRMRADVPVGAYLSGGLDSSIVCRLAADRSPHQLRSFSVTFADPRLDESRYQLEVARTIGSLHVVQHIGSGDIAEAFPTVIRHAETPLVRTAPVPMFLLARRTREHGIVVVLTGEGSDELFLGYDLFKEVVVRQFCLRQPGSAVRPRLFERLYPYLGEGRSGDFWRQFFLNAGAPDDPLFSHMPRFLMASWMRGFYADGMRDTVSHYDALGELRDTLPPAFATWAPEHRAAYLEMVTLLSPYLLSSQSDRVGMAWAVEARFPFLDHRLFEFAARLPVRSKLRGLREKEILKRWSRGLVPPAILKRAKQPYRAPDAAALFGETPAEWVEELMSSREVARAGLFRPGAVEALVRRCRAGVVTSFRENQALVAILSTQAWHRQFMVDHAVPPPLPLAKADVLMLSDVSAPHQLSRTG